MSSWLCGERQRVHESSEEEAELDPGCPLSLSSIWSTVDSAILGEKVTVDNLTFRVERKLAEGGFGSILLAHSHDRQTVAIKRTLASAPELEHKARAEAYAMRFVQHPAIMKLIAHAPGSVHNTLPFGQPPTRCYHLVTPAYLEGSLVTAWDCIRSDNSHCLRLATAEVVHLALQLAEGLDAMHSRGITHRDVTPSNVMLDSTTDDPRAVLTDFGSCRNSPIEVHTSHEAHETQEAAQSNTTAPCRPPELWYCQYPCTLDGRVDVWSFGCTLFFAMYGSNAFDADSGSVYLAAINGRLNWSGVDKERHSQQLLSVVHECLTVELPDRPTAAQIASRLRALKATFPLYSASISNSEDIP